MARKRLGGFITTTALNNYYITAKKKKLEEIPECKKTSNNAIQIRANFPSVCLSLKYNLQEQG